MRNPFRRSPVEPPPPEQPPRPLTAEDEDDLRELARALVRPGFTDRSEVVLALTDYLEDTAGAGVAEAAERITAEEWSRREAELAAAATSAGPSDYDRLAAAFAALESQGVLARMAFTCCNTCGTTEIDDERTPVEPLEGSGYGFAQWAYTFFHQQDAERLADASQPLYLTYSAFVPAPGVDPRDLAASRAGDDEARRRVVDETDRVVGELVREALVAQGLQVTWDGSPGQRIQVATPDWRKPLPVG